MQDYYIMQKILLVTTRVDWASENQPLFKSLRILVNKTLENIDFSTAYDTMSRSQWPRGLRRRSSAARLLRLWVRIQPESWMFVCCEYCVLSGRGLFDGLINRPEESYRMWRVVVRDQETSKTRRLKATTGLWKYNHNGLWRQEDKQTYDTMNRQLLITVIKQHGISDGLVRLKKAVVADRHC